MKLFVILLAILVAVNCLNINWDETSERQGRIASGSPLPKGKFLDFCSLRISFFQKQKTCGCFIVAPSYVVTSARCVYDCSEGKATNATVTVAGKPYAIADIIVPPADLYAAAEDTLSNIVVGNAAVIKLTAPLNVDDKTISLSTPVPQPVLAQFFEFAASPPPGVTLKYWACGVGITNNQGVPPKGPMCTQVNVLPPSACLDLISGAAFEVPPVENEQFCVQWPNRDNNICSGDYGGPIYVEQFDPAPPGGKPPPSVILNIGLAVGSPDIRPNAPCQDGHTVFAQLYTTNILNFNQIAMGLPPLPSSKLWNDAPWQKYIKN